MYCERELPDNFDCVFSVNNSKDKKPSKAVNIIALIIAIVMVVPMAFIFPLTVFLDVSDKLVLMVAVFTVGELGYLVLHEVIHLIFMKIFGSITAKISFNGILVYAHLDECMQKKPYFITVLAPIVILGLILVVINLLVPSDWFWIIYLLQIANVAGGSADYYILNKLRKLPPSTLVCDTGLEFSAYAEVQNDKNL